ncbi:MAG: hypothetical protein QW520_02525 [Methanomassiliicoccales archaeon]
MAYGDDRKKVEAARDLIYQLYYDLAHSSWRMEEILYKYEEGWEDEALACIIGAFLYIDEVLDKIYHIFEDEVIDFSEAEMVDEP